MNLSGLSELLLAWFKGQDAAALGKDKAGPAHPLLLPGKEYAAKVLDNLPTGRHLVQVAGQKMDMPLPRGTQPGETLRLTYLGGAARPTFLLNQTASPAPVSAGQPVSLSSAAQQVGALSRLAGPTASPVMAGGAVPVGTAGLSTAVSPPAGANLAPAFPGPAASISRAPPGVGEAVAKLPANPPLSTTVAVPGALIAQRPGGAVSSAEAAIKSMPPANGPTLATASHPIASPEMLAKPSSAPLSPPTSSAPPAAQMAQSAAVVTSGRPIAANVVMLNTAVSAMPLAPGGAVSPNTALVGQAVEGLRASVPSSTTLMPSVVAELPEPSRGMLPARLSQTLSESGLFYESHLSRWAKGELSFDTLLREPQARLGRELPMGARVAELGGMPDEVARLAGRQLQLLDGAPLVWQGFAWPGQWMQWQVEERYPDGGEGGGEEEGAHWVTELHLHLPRMGSVHAHIGLRGDRLDLRLTAQEPAVREAMQSALPALVNGLEAAGLRPANLTVGLADET